MPFDNPHQAPFGDIELLREARSRISSKSDWVQGRFRDGHRECLVAALSVVSGSRAFNMPNRTERRLARLLAVHIPRRRAARACPETSPATAAESATGAMKTATSTPAVMSAGTAP